MQMTWKQWQIYFGQNLVCKENVSEGKAKMVKKKNDPVIVLQKVCSAAEAAA